MKSPDLAECYSGFLFWRTQYKLPALLFFPSPFVPACYISVAMRGSAADQTQVRTIALSEFVFMTGAMFIVNIKDGVCLTY